MPSRDANTSQGREHATHTMHRMLKPLHDLQNREHESPSQQSPRCAPSLMLPLTSACSRAAILPPHLLPPHPLLPRPLPLLLPPRSGTLRTSGRDRRARVSTLGSGGYGFRACARAAIALQHPRAGPVSVEASKSRTPFQARAQAEADTHQTPSRYGVEC